MGRYKKGAEFRQLGTSMPEVCHSSEDVGAGIIEQRFLFDCPACSDIRQKYVSLSSRPFLFQTLSSALSQVHVVVFLEISCLSLI